MAGSLVNKRTLRLFLAAIVLEFLFIVLPWWTLILVYEGQVASFNLFLFGAAKTGFQTATLSFEWWSYLTIAIIAFGAFVGLFGYRFLALGKNNGRKLAAVNLTCMIGACLFYVTNLALTFATLRMSFQEYWIAVPNQSYGPITIAILNVISFRMANFNGQLLAFEFLSAGFILALVSSLLLLITTYSTRASNSN